MAIDRELETFRRLLPSMLADPTKAGFYALVHGDQVAGIYPTFDAALAAGYERYELAPFLVKQVTAQEPPRYVSRNLKPCR